MRIKGIKSSSVLSPKCFVSKKYGLKEIPSYIMTLNLLNKEIAIEISSRLNTIGQMLVLKDETQCL